MFLKNFLTREYVGTLISFLLMQQDSYQTKGQLILKYHFGAFKSSKKTNKLFSRISALASKKSSNQKNKGALHH